MKRFIVFTLLLMLASCKEKTLVPLEAAYLDPLQYASVDADFCTRTSNEYRQRLKYIFVLDKSSSNNNPGDPSDPAGFRRYAPLYNFIDNATADPGFTYYSLINFSDNSVVAQNFTDSKDTFKAKILAEWNARAFQTPNDQGYTNYVSALRSVSQIIEDDVVVQKKSLDPSIVSSVYVVVFVSDGYPWILDLSQASHQRKQIFDPEIKNEINAILSHKDNAYYKAYIDGISLHTGYYYNSAPDTDARDLLGQMAGLGSGSLYSFGGGASIDFKKFAVPVRHVRYTLSDVFVENASATWWDDGRYLKDSDADGIPDEIEVKLGSNPKMADSDGNGVSDFVEYRMKGKPCKDGTCSHEITKRDNYTACVGLLPKTNPDGTPNPAPDGVNTVAGTGTNYFNDADGDGLNECEEFLLRADKSNFDSNEDHLPDFFAMKAQMPFVKGAKTIQSNPAGDNISNYEKAKIHLPVFITKDQIPNFKPVKYELRQTDNLDDSQCYHLSASDVAIVGYDNLIRVYATMNTSVIELKPVLIKAEGILSGDSKELRFEKETFK